jgi:hypothetical protein
MWYNTLGSIILLTLSLLLAPLVADAQQPSKTVFRNGLPKFGGEFGHYERSKRFYNFIFKNQHKLVYIDAHYVPDDPNEVKIVNNTFGVDGFQLWDKCFEPLAPKEKPWYGKCTGTYFALDRSGSNKDSDITYIRGTLRVQGYFAIRGCDGPHQGSMGCTLRPLNPEEVR